MVNGSKVTDEFTENVYQVQNGQVTVDVVGEGGRVQVVFECLDEVRLKHTFVKSHLFTKLFPPDTIIVVLQIKIGSTNYWVLNGKRVRTAQAPPHHIHTTPVPTSGVSGT